MKSVFPTHVGVFLLHQSAKGVQLGLPHARGGVSRFAGSGTYMSLSSPRTWGCFSSALPRAQGAHVFPTHVGVFPNQEPPLGRVKRLPHARGGVSSRVALLISAYPSSPRTWGCFWFEFDGIRWVRVFPTHVGVFLNLFPHPSGVPSLPHARGGVSFRDSDASDVIQSSPRTWGCFFP